MATIRQKRVAKTIIENLPLQEPMSGGDIVDASGYGKSMRLYPGRILQSVGVRAELRQLGFSVEAADQVIWQLLHKGKKEDTKLKAAQEIYKRMGAYEDTKQGAIQPTAILNFLFNGIRGDNSNQKDSGNEKTSEDSSGRNISVKDSIDSLISDTPSSK